MKDKCSRKWATPLLASVSNLEPASIQIPTVAVLSVVVSVATLNPFESVVILVLGKFESEDAYGFESDKADGVGVVLYERRRNFDSISKEMFFLKKVGRRRDGIEEVILFIIRNLKFPARSNVTRAQRTTVRSHDCACY